jgi:hypothetical protein
MSIPAGNIFRFIGAGMAVVALAAALNFAVDPLQIFRPARFYQPTYSNESRLQNAGLIRSQDFDTVFMGTSLAIHFRQSDLDRMLGVRSLKLAMPGSNSREQNFVLAAALERSPRRIIWEMDDWIFHDAPDIDATTYFPADLYRRNLRGLTGYLLSGAMAREALWMLARQVTPLRQALTEFGSDALIKFAVPRVDDINCLAADFNTPADYNAAKARAAFVHITDPVRSRYLSEGYDYGAMVGNFERDVAGLIEKHPDVMFEVYFPPYSILQFVAMRDASPATLKIVYDLSGYISRRLAQFPNVRVHDFRAVKSITHDLANYADVIHHSPAIDLKVISYLANGDHVVDRDAPTETLERLKAQVAAYQP